MSQDRDQDYDDDDDNAGHTNCPGQRDRGSAPLLPPLLPLLSVGGTVPLSCADPLQIANICDSQYVILHTENHKYLRFATGFLTLGGNLYRIIVLFASDTQTKNKSLTIKQKFSKQNLHYEFSLPFWSAEMLQFF